MEWGSRRIQREASQVLVHSPNAQMTEARPGQSQQPAMQSQSSMWAAQPWYLSHHSYFPGVHQ